jgi:two-component system response regulator AtoC
VQFIFRGHPRGAQDSCFAAVGGRKLIANLLLIDDDSVISGVLCDLLRNEYDCHTADCAEQAVRYLERETYDVILTDIFMPRLGGFEILNRIRDIHPTTPVIIISGTTLDDKEKLLRMGAFTFLPKPFQLGELLDAVARAIAYRQSMGGNLGLKSRH